MDKEVTKTVEILEKGGIILYPTDTVWGLGCDALNSAAVQSIFSIKKREESKSLIILVENIETLSNFTNFRFNPEIIKILSSERPTTIIYPQAINLASNVINQNGTIAIRIVHHPFCSPLLQQFGRPIVSTSANVSGRPTPQRRQDIDPEIIAQVDYCVDYPEDPNIANQPSRILALNPNHTFEVIRP